MSTASYALSGFMWLAHITVPKSRGSLMHTPASTIGHYVAELLAANGIDTVFGIPGVHTLELYRGFAASGLRHVLVRHEQAAGFAADGYARVSGRPAAALRDFRAGRHQYPDRRGAGIFGLGADAHRREHARACITRSEMGCAPRAA
jgi:hypothetical protein